MRKIRLGISSCLLGNPVRYDGQHQRNAFLCDVLGPLVDYVPVCPEVECGLPVPRESMRLAGDPAAPRLVTNFTGRDLTDQMNSWVKHRLDELAAADLDGFVFKKDSPSSGLERVKVFNAKGAPVKTGRGLFAGAFIARFPQLPVIEEGMLNDRFLRERFLNRIFAAARRRELDPAGNRRRQLSDFQARHKLTLLCHAPGRYPELGRLAETGDFAAYFAKLDELLTLRPTLAKHINVMHHILGYFKTDLDGWEKQEVLDCIEACRQSRTPLAVPLALLRHYVRKYHKNYLLDQTYWGLLGPYYL